MDSQFFPGAIQLDHPDVIFIGTVLLRHIQQLICNAHAITVMSRDSIDEPVSTLSQDKLASAIYPTASLMNHSCKPNIIARYRLLLY